MHRLRVAAALLMGLSALNVAHAGCGSWPRFEQFAARFISADGRVIDPSTPRQITTSEGQSYAMLFALVAGDRTHFEQLLQWTQNNLAQGDLTAHLPAWEWGRADDGQWRVLDANPASDADLWIAYDLIEAAQRWDDRRYRILGKVLAHRIFDEETAVLPGLGRTVLPAPTGFVVNAHAWRLNPSYLPLQLLQALASVDPDRDWAAVRRSAVTVLLASAARGFAPDWIVYDADAGFLPDALTHADGSYAAIRVYLWAGMLDANDPQRSPLLTRLMPMAQAVARDGHPPEYVDTRDGSLRGTGPVGFSAALLPFLAAENQTEALARQKQRVEAATWPPTGYYDAVLTLFGAGFAEQRFRFDENGGLVIGEGACGASH